MMFNLTHNFIKQNDFYNDRYRHSFLVVEPKTWPVALDALEKEYKRKNRMQDEVPTPGDFLKYRIKFKRVLEGGVGDARPPPPLKFSEIRVLGDTYTCT